MEIFTQFSSDLDEATKRQLAYGQGLMYLLRQPQNNPFKLHEQVIMLVAATANVMQDIPIDDIADFRRKLLDYFHEEEDASLQADRFNRTALLMKIKQKL